MGLLPPRSSLTLRLMELLQEESYLDFSVTPSQRLLKTSELYAQEKKVLEIQEKTFISRTQSSIESLMDSWLKVVISPMEMVLEENQSMVLNSMMRTSLLSIPRSIFYQWPTLDQTLMDPNFSSHSHQLHGSMESTPFSEKCLKELMLLMLLKKLVQEVEPQSSQLRLLTLENLPVKNDLDKLFRIN